MAARIRRPPGGAAIGGAAMAGATISGSASRAPSPRALAQEVTPAERHLGDGLGRSERGAAVQHGLTLAGGPPIVPAAAGSASRPAGRSTWVGRPARRTRNPPGPPGVTLGTCLERSAG
jgi:hypothetical protein